MALPQLAVPKFKINLPSDKSEIEFRPFLVKEEKVLLIASESKDNQQMIDAMTSVVNSCVLNPNFSLKSLPFFDAEYLFLQLRGKSVGEQIKLYYHHAQNVNRKGEDCSVSTAVNINLEDIKIDLSTALDSKIMLTDDFGVIMRYPSINDVLNKNNDENLDEIEIVAKCIVHAFDNDQIYESDTLEEAKRFVESLSSAQFAKISEFFEKAPQLTHTFTYKCDGCGQEDVVTLKGIADFF